MYNKFLSIAAAGLLAVGFGIGEVKAEENSPLSWIVLDDVWTDENKENYHLNNTGKIVATPVALGLWDAPLVTGAVVGAVVASPVAVPVLYYLYGEECKSGDRLYVKRDKGIGQYAFNCNGWF